MGYNLYITRATDWFSEKKQPRIAPKEWLKVIQNDPSLKLAGYNGKYFALCAGDAECGKSTYTDAWLDWSDGNIYSKNPAGPLQRKMVKIAEQLDATVRGDDGETYNWEQVRSKE
jgi:hypothetical protein